MNKNFINKNNRDKFIFKGSLALECYFDLNENGNNDIELFRLSYGGYRYGN